MLQQQYLRADLVLRSRAHDLLTSKTLARLYVQNNKANASVGQRIPCNRGFRKAVQVSVGRGGGAKDAGMDQFPRI